MKEKKYKFTEDMLELYGHILHRIQALKSFNNIKKGDLGGWIEKEDNLSQDGECWVYKDACVYDNAKITNNSFVHDYSLVYGNAIVEGNTMIQDNAEIFGNAKIFGNAFIHGHAKVYDASKVFGSAKIYGNAKIYGYANIGDKAVVYGNAEVYGYTSVFGNAEVRDRAKVFGNVEVFGNTEITGNAEVKCIKDYIIFKNNWSSGRFFTWTKSNNMWKVGCFYGTGKELINKAYADSKESGRRYKATVKYVNKIEGKNLTKRIINMLKR